MQVLFVTSEIAPVIKTGGLADVSAALPAALYSMGVDIRVLLPGYPQVLKSLLQLQVAVDFCDYPPSGFTELPPSRLLFDVLPNGVPLYVFDCPEMYMRGGGPYQDEFGHDWDDNAQRFGLFSKVAALLGSANTPLKWKPDVVHCNDWQTGLTPAYLQYAKAPAPCVMTVHNLAFQGIFPSSLMPELDLPWDCFRFDGVEFFGDLSFLKAGLSYSKHITTVSPSYALEIQTKELGFGLQDLLVYRHETLTGILNGIDMDEWNPSADSYLDKNYNAEDLSGKLANKLALQKRMGLKQDPEIPVFGLVSRFANQKGLDLVLEIAEKLIALPAQLVLLGSGDADLQKRALLLAHQNSGKIAAYVGFEEGLSHLIEAGADIFLMPSRFEPCGLNQMYSQRYGTPPVVHATGGLIDTVVDCDVETIALGTASGFVFDEIDAATLLTTVQRAVDAYQNKKIWRALQKNCMLKDFSWKKSAQSYLEIYTQLKLKPT